MKRLFIALVLVVGLAPISRAFLDVRFGTEKELPTLELPYDIQIDEVGSDSFMLRILARLPPDTVGEPRKIRVCFYSPLVRDKNGIEKSAESQIQRAVDLEVPTKLRPSIPHSVTFRKIELSSIILVLEFWQNDGNYPVLFEIYLEDLWKLRNKNRANQPLQRTPDTEPAASAESDSRRR